MEEGNRCFSTQLTIQIYILLLDRDLIAQLPWENSPAFLFLLRTKL